MSQEPVSYAVKKQMVSPKGAAEMLGVSTRTIRKYIHDRKLPAARINARVIRIRVADIERMLAERAA